MALKIKASDKTEEKDKRKEVEKRQRRDKEKDKEKEIHTLNSKIMVGHCNINRMENIIG